MLKLFLTHVKTIPNGHSRSYMTPMKCRMTFVKLTRLLMLLSKQLMELTLAAMKKKSLHICLNYMRKQFGKKTEKSLKLKKISKILQLSKLKSNESTNSKYANSSAGTRMLPISCYVRSN